MIARNEFLCIKPASGSPAALILAGPRQTGKTHLAHLLFPSHRHISLALPSEATRACLDPTAFLAAAPAPVVIDDVHLAPRLIDHVRREVDRRPYGPASFVLVGSRPRLLTRTACEAFGTESCVMPVEGLSYAESAAACPNMPLGERLLRGGFPALYADQARDPAEYLRGLVADHLHRELPGQLRVDDVHAFECFLRATAMRTARLLNKAELAREVGIVGSTAAIWLDTLIEAGVVALVKPWQPLRGKPLVKAPKLYFLDTGLCSHLLGLHTAHDLVASPHAAALWETFVHAEIRRLATASAPAAEPVFYRDRTKEADFVVPTPRGLAILDVAWSEFPATSDVRRLLRIREEIGASAVAHVAIVCRTPDRQALREPAGPAVETVGLEDLPAILGLRTSNATVKGSATPV